MDIEHIGNHEEPKPQTDLVYSEECGLSKTEWELEKIVDEIKATNSTLECIKILQKLITL